ncbi:MAG: hypothetical protein R2911_22225 [Caldilineaceae bacterium]
MVFKKPDSTMNPSYTVGQQIGRPLLRFSRAKSRCGRRSSSCCSVRLGENPRPFAAPAQRRRETAAWALRALYAARSGAL